MPSTDSFVSSALVVTATAQTFMSVEAFTSSAVAVTTGVGHFLNKAVGSTLLTVKGYLLRVTPAGVSVSKGATALAFPISLDDARELAVELLKAVN